MAPKKRLIKHEDVRVGWVAAIPTEVTAARSMLDEEFRLPYQKHGDENNYTVGRIGNHVVAIASPADTLEPVSVTHTAWWLQQSFPRLRIGLMVGIAGGVPLFEENLRLGDVVVSVPEGISSGVINYDNGKFVEDGFQVRGNYNRPPDILRNAANKIKSDRAFKEHRGTVEAILAAANKKRVVRVTRPPLDSDELHCPDGPHAESHTNPFRRCRRCKDTGLVPRPQRPQNLPFQVFHGLVASGRKLMADAKKRDSIARSLNLAHGYKILCYEMEAAYLMNTYPCLVIRGISDYSDKWKNDDWQDYAAFTAAAYGKELLQSIAVEEADRETSLQEKAVAFGSFEDLLQAANQIGRHYSHVPTRSPTPSRPASRNPSEQAAPGGDADIHTQSDLDGEDSSWISVSRKAQHPPPRPPQAPNKPRRSPRSKPPKSAWKDVNGSPFNPNSAMPPRGQHLSPHDAPPSRRHYNDRRSTGSASTHRDPSAQRSVSPYGTTSSNPLPNGRRPPSTPREASSRRTASPFTTPSSSQHLSARPTASTTASSTPRSLSRRSSQSRPPAIPNFPAPSFHSPSRHSPETPKALARDYTFADAVRQKKPAGLDSSVASLASQDGVPAAPSASTTSAETSVASLPPRGRRRREQPHQQRATKASLEDARRPPRTPPPPVSLASDDEHVPPQMPPPPPPRQPAKKASFADALKHNLRGAGSSGTLSGVGVVVAEKRSATPVALSDFW